LPVVLLLPGAVPPNDPGKSGDDNDRQFAVPMVRGNFCLTVV